MPRALSIAAVVVAIAACAVLFFGGSAGSYEVTVVLPDASQLVKGNLVKVGGLPVGSVSEIRLNERRQAEVDLEITEARFRPLRRGTRAEVMLGSLSGVANRVVALTPGPQNRPSIPEGGVIGADLNRPAVEVDQVLNTLDAQTRSSLQRLFHGSATALSKRERAANRGLAALSPALSETAATMREVNRDQPALERFIVQSAAVVSSVGSRSDDLEQGIENGADVADEIASRTGALSSLLRDSPGTLRRANTTLVNLRPALRELRPALREAQPVAPRAARVLKTLGPVTANARPALRDLRGLLPDVDLALRRLPRLERATVPALRSTRGAVDGAQPIVTGLRPLVPDILLGMTNNFGGTLGGYYDANGAYGRVGAYAGGNTLEGLLNLPVPVGGEFRGHTARCPGGASQPALDNSNPWQPIGLPCDPRQVP